jgi:hypothetical protein
MCVEKAIHVLAGTLVLIGTISAILVSHWWLLLVGFVGANLVQSAFTGFCPAEKIFRRLGLKSQCCSQQNP